MEPSFFSGMEVLVVVFLGIAMLAGTAIFIKWLSGGYGDYEGW